MGPSLASARPNPGRVDAYPKKLEEAPARVLIVEDDLNYAVELMRALRVKDPNFPTARFEIDITPDPAVALECADRDSVDIFIVDLRFKEPNHPDSGSAEIGKRLILDIQERTNAGIIVHTSVPDDVEGASTIALGADDYIEKMSLDGGFRGRRTVAQVIRAKIVALWRRVQLMRSGTATKFQHANRVFQIGVWQFHIGSRTLVSDTGEEAKLTPTEHALLRYLCVIDGHEIDREQFNASILGRDAGVDDRRIDNMVYRLRVKLGPSLQLISNHKKGYILVGVQESKSTS